MKIFAKLGLAAGAVALFAGCGRFTSPPMGSPGAMWQSRAMGTHAHRGGSWMLPEAKGEDLLYASNQSNVDEGVYVFSYPKGKLVGELTGFSYNAPAGLCSDSKGNIFVTSGWLSSSGQFQGQIDEYAHGGASPIETLSDPAAANGCAIDPATGNLAVTNWAGQAGSLTTATWQFIRTLRGRQRFTIPQVSIGTGIAHTIIRATSSSMATPRADPIRSPSSLVEAVRL